MEEPKEVRVYFADTAELEDPALFGRLFGTVSAQRREKISRTEIGEVKRCSLAVELLLKKAMEDAGLAYAGREMRFGEFGKPYFENGPHFGLSHSGEQAMCVLSPVPVGCDVERVRPVNPKIAERFFTLDEAAALAAAPSDAAREEAFFRTWVLKESYIKLSGRGMSVPFRSYGVDIACDPPQLTVPEEEKVCFFEAALCPGYRFAWCTGGTAPLPFTVTQVRLGEL